LKKSIYILCLAATLLFSGCQTQEDVVVSSPEIPIARTVYGKIKEINGNEILLALASESNNDFRQSSGNPSSRSDTNSTASGYEGRSGGISRGESYDASQVQENMGEMSQRSASMPYGGASIPSQEGGRGQSGSGSGQRQGTDLQGGTSPNTSVQLTGEEEIFLIPVTAILTNGQGDNANIIQFTQLAVKNVIRLYMDEEDVIIRVEVLQ
jgi:hypothetical protein